MRAGPRACGACGRPKCEVCWHQGRCRMGTEEAAGVGASRGPRTDRCVYNQAGPVSRRTVKAREAESGRIHVGIAWHASARPQMVVGSCCDGRSLRVSARARAWGASWLTGCRHPHHTGDCGEERSAAQSIPAAPAVSHMHGVGGSPLCGERGWMDGRWLGAEVEIQGWGRRAVPCTGRLLGFVDSGQCG